jgi:Ni/Co efflux regulator RcnB
MIKKLIVVAMLIATLGLGSLAYAQDTGGEKGRRTHRHNRGNRGAIEWTYRRRHEGRRHRRHRRSGGDKPVKYRGTRPRSH